MLQNLYSLGKKKKMSFCNVSHYDCAASARTFPVSDGAEPQLDQCSRAQFESISPPSSQSYGRIFPLVNRRFSCPHKSIKATPEDCPQMDSLPASPSPTLKWKRDLAINCASVYVTTDTRHSHPSELREKLLLAVISPLPM